MQLTESEMVSDTARALCTEIGIRYYHLSPVLEEVVGLGETNRDKLIQLVIDANRCEETRRQVDQIISDLGCT